MKEKDGHRILHSGNSEQEVRIAACTRWDEIRDCVNYHINLAGLLDAPTRFRVRAVNQHCSGWCRVPALFYLVVNLTCAFSD